MDRALHAMRHDAQVQYDALSDFSSWVSAMQEKDQSLHGMKSTLAPGSNTAAVGSLEIRPPRPIRNVVTQRVGGSLNQTSSGPTVPNAISGEKDTNAADLRARGNDAFRQKNYAAAVKLYDQAVQAARSANDSLEAALALSNRCQGYLQLQSWQRAGEDATEALRLDPAAPKVWLRRAHALNALGKHTAALADVEVAAALLAAAVDTAVDQRSRLRADVSAELARTRRLVQDADDRVDANARPADEVQVALREIDADSESADIYLFSGDIRGLHGSLVNSTLLRPSSVTFAPPAPVLPEPTPNKQNPPAAVDKTAVDAKPGLPQKTPAAAAVAAAAPEILPLLRSQPEDPPTPRTSYELERDWRTLTARVRTQAAGDTRERAGHAAPRGWRADPRASYLLLTVDPALLPAMYRAGVEPDLLGAMLAVADCALAAAAAGGSGAECGDVEARVRRMLGQLAFTRGFGLALSMLDDEGEAALRSLRGRVPGAL